MFVHPLETIRKNLGLTQKEFAEKLGYSIASISRIESGRQYPFPEVIKRLQRDFGVTAQQFHDAYFALNPQKQEATNAK